MAAQIFVFAKAGALPAGLTIQICRPATYLRMRNLGLRPCVLLVGLVLGCNRVILLVTVLRPLS